MSTATTTPDTTKDAMSAKDAKPITVTAAKGRPMLNWVGKRPLGMLTPFPAQLVERYGAASDDGNALFHGDNKEVLTHLLARGLRGKVNLVYIDPPFDSGADYVRKVSLRGVAGASKMEGDGYTLGEQVQYTDIWANDNYLQFMYERLLLLKELLTEDGSIYLHCDWHKSHFLRCIVDEVFGPDNFHNQIVWHYRRWTAGSGSYQNMHDVILFASKGGKWRFNKVYAEPTEGQRRKMERGYDSNVVNIDGRRQAQLIVYNKEKVQAMFAAGTLDATRYARTIYKEEDGVAASDVFTDIDYINSQATEREDYPTQKPEALLQRIIEASTNPGDLVLDCFVGSGTTCAVAQKLGRRWVGADINKGAIQTTSKRLQAIMEAQTAAHAKAHGKNGKAAPVPHESEDADPTAAEVPATPDPPQTSFAVWRVNDYDLQQQHNEAVSLACEHLGVTRTRTDAFFDGTRGNALVKIVSFTHPLSPLDLEQVKQEFANRPGETRPVVMVCLGVELAAQAWLEDYNRLLKKTDPNRIEYVELRTDSKYGKFFEHRPAQAQVTVTRTAGHKGHVQIDNFTSPTILERLASAAGVLQPQITDWRAMVDCVLIDAHYDGAVFNVALSDVPEKKTDLVAGKYEIALPAKPATVAVKIVDMLGEEVLVTQSI